MTGIAEALDNPDLLAPHFAGESWARWRAILRAAEGLALDEAEAALFREVAERDPPAQRVRELWVIAGRRSGKDSAASAIATVAALGDYCAYLRPGERAAVLCLACDRDQARIVLRYVKGYFSKIPALAALVERETDDGLELANSVEIVVATNSFRAVRGRTIVCAIFDEVAYWRDESSATPDLETYNAVEPGLATLPGAMLIGISSPYRRAGLLFQKWQQSFGKPDDAVLVVRGATPLFNPSLPQRIIDAAMERDPEAAAAEWLAQWRSDLSDFIDRAIVEGCVARGVHELPPVPGISYCAFVDPSGGSADSFTVAISHRDRDGRGVLDLLREVRPPFSPESVVAEFAGTLKAYSIRKIVGDRYAGIWPVEAFSRHGITYEQSAAPKSELYLSLLPLLNSGRVDLLDNPRLVAQLCGLERRTSRAGKDAIDHPRGSHDDLANSAAGALVAVTGKAAAPLVFPAAVKAWAAAPGARRAGGARVPGRALFGPRPGSISAPRSFTGSASDIFDGTKGS